MATSMIARTGTLGAGTTLISCAKRTHRKRPRSIPSGTPTTTPMPTETVVDKPDPATSMSGAVLRPLCLAVKRSPGGLVPPSDIASCNFDNQVACSLVDRR